MTGSIFAIWLSLLGLAVSSGAPRGPWRPLVAAALALPVGAAIWIAAAVVLMLAGLPIGLVTLAASSALLAAISAWAVGGGTDVRLAEWGWAILCVLALAVVPSLVTRMMWTSDSLFMMLMADDLVRFGSLTPITRDWYLTAYPLAIPVLALPELIVQPPMLPSILTVFGASAALLATTMVIQRCSGATRLAILASAATGLILLSSPQITMQVTYVNGHLLVACLVLAYFAVEEKPARYFGTVVRSLCLAGIVLSRVEGVLVAVLMLCAQPSSAAVSPVARALPPLAVAITAALSLGQVAFNPDAAPDVLDQLKAWALASTGLVCAAVFFLLASAGFERLIRLFPALAIGGLAAVICAMAAVMPSHMAAVVANLASNMFAEGGWYIIWPVVTVLAAMALILRFRSAVSDPRLMFAVAYLLFLVALGGLYAIPYRVGPFDSGNRILVHILPLILAALLSLFFSQDGDERG